MDNKYKRITVSSVLCFLNFEDEYLFLKRAETKKIDPGKINGVGGKLEPRENHLEAAIREIEEETSYRLIEQNLKFEGIIRLESDLENSEYAEDWVMTVFSAEVSEKVTKFDKVDEEGELFWSKLSDIKNNSDLITDVKLIIDYLEKDDSTFYMNAVVNNEFEITHHSLDIIKR